MVCDDFLIRIKCQIILNYQNVESNLVISIFNLIKPNRLIADISIVFMFWGKLPDYLD